MTEWLQLPFLTILADLAPHGGVYAFTGRAMIVFTTLLATTSSIEAQFLGFLYDIFTYEASRRGSKRV